jgi:hypothetical protein
MSPSHFPSYYLASLKTRGTSPPPHLANLDAPGQYYRPFSTTEGTRNQADLGCDACWPGHEIALLPRVTNSAWMSRVGGDPGRDAQSSTNSAMSATRGMWLAQPPISLRWRRRIAHETLPARRGHVPAADHASDRKVTAIPAAPRAVQPARAQQRQDQCDPDTPHAPGGAGPQHRLHLPAISRRIAR